MTTHPTTLHTAIAAISALIFSAAAFAQTSRTDVKADAASNRASSPRGELSTPNQDKGDSARPAQGTQNSRAAVKADAAAATRAGTKPTGQSSVKDQDKGEGAGTGQGSQTGRAAVKAEAASATKAGTKPMGQASQKDQDKGVTKP